MKNKKWILAYSMLFIALISVAAISARKSNQLIWVEFCDPGTIGKCLVKSGAGDGFRCYAADINETKDCSGSHWVDI